jgi:HEPN domain-containing protein
MLHQARRRLVTVRREVAAGGYAYAVRTAQECVELSLKAALRLVGIDYPKKHDVSRILLHVRARFPTWFDVSRFAEVSRELAAKREPAMYGVEAKMQPAEDLFTKQDAATALKQAVEVHRSCVRLLTQAEAA